ncbi:MAG: AMP-binding protein [Planctomycetota bacterium]
MDKADSTGDPVLVRDLREHLKRFKHRVAQVRPNRSGGSDLELSFEQLLQITDQIAAALKRLGVARGSAVALIAENSERWLAADLAIMSCGGICVPRGTGASDAEIAFILERTRADVAFVEHPELLDRLRGMRTRLKSRILLYGDAEAGALSFEQLLGSTKQTSVEDDVRAIRPDDVASIVFTSGTTGNPKGVILTHRNLGSNLSNLRDVIHCWQPGETYLSILPTWHAFERIAEYLLLSMGVGIVYSDRRNLKRDLRTYQPNAFAAVPRVWMMIADAINYEIAQLNWSQRTIARLSFAIRNATVRLRRVAANRTLHSHGAVLRRLAAALAALLQPIDWCADRAVFAPLRHKSGLANLVHGAGISGGGSLPQYVDDFFECTGITFLNGYGLTETSPVLTIRVPDHNVPGSVGRPLPGTHIRIVPDEKARESGAGRIMVAGPQVMQGYRDDPQASAAVLNGDGWLDTGDLGLQTAAGDVVITGRAKDTIVLLNGENVEPEPIEVRLLESPWIQQVVVLGQDQKFIGAIVVPNYQALRADPQYGKADEPVIEQLIRREIDARISERNGFRSHERIHRFLLLEREFSITDGTLSQTLKLRRHRINELHKDAIARLFGGEAPDV